MNQNSRDRDLTALIQAWAGGNDQALDLLIPKIYAQLESMARQHMRKERSGHTLQTSALINECYLELQGQQNLRFESRQHFFFYASRIMRHILIRHARHHQAQKRGQGVQGIQLVPDIQLADGKALSVEKLLILEKSLERLEEIDQRQAQIVTLRFFGGFKNTEIADLLGISLTTIKDDWKLAKSWLAHQLAPKDLST